MLRCADPVPPLKTGAMAIMVLGLTTNLVPDPQRSEGEKLVTRLTLSMPSLVIASVILGSSCSDYPREADDIDYSIVLEGLSGATNLKFGNL
jgi:hypothetical protein